MNKKPNLIFKAYRLSDREGETARVVTQCIGCGWESHPIKSDVTGDTLLEEIASIPPFNKGMLAGAFINHFCKVEENDKV